MAYKIKTICIDTTQSKEFDRMVNAAIRGGWSLVRRYAIAGSPDEYAKLIAELRKYY